MILIIYRYFSKEFECGLITLPDVSKFKIETEEEKLDKFNEKRPQWLHNIWENAIKFKSQ